MRSRASRRTVDPKRAIEAASGACPRNPLGELEPLETAAEAGQGVLRRIGLDIELLDLVELTLQIGQLALVRAPFLLMLAAGHDLVLVAADVGLERLQILVGPAPALDVLRARHDGLAQRARLAGEAVHAVLDRQVGERAERAEDRDEHADRGDDRLPLRLAAGPHLRRERGDRALDLLEAAVRRLLEMQELLAEAVHALLERRVLRAGIS